MWGVVSVQPQPVSGINLGVDVCGRVGGCHSAAPAWKCSVVGCRGRRCKHNRSMQARSAVELCALQSQHNMPCCVHACSVAVGERNVEAEGAV